MVVSVRYVVFPLNNNSLEGFYLFFGVFGEFIITFFYNLMISELSVLWMIKF